MDIMASANQVLGFLVYYAFSWVWLGVVMAFVALGVITICIHEKRPRPNAFANISGASFCGAAACCIFFLIFSLIHAPLNTLKSEVPAHPAVGKYETALERYDYAAYYDVLTSWNRGFAQGQDLIFLRVAAKNLDPEMLQSLNRDIKHGVLRRQRYDAYIKELSTKSSATSGAGQLSARQLMALQPASQ